MANKETKVEKGKISKVRSHMTSVEELGQETGFLTIKFETLTAKSRCRKKKKKPRKKKKLQVQKGKTEIPEQSLKH